MRGQDVSIADSLRQTLHDIQDLIRAELALVRTEVGIEATRLRAGLLALAVAAVFAGAGFMFALAAVSWGIVQALDWPIWTGFALVAGGTIPFTIAFTIAGVWRLNRSRHMPHTVDTMKENVR